MVFGFATMRMQREVMHQSEDVDDAVLGDVVRALHWRRERFRVEPFLVTHEVVEKALLGELGLHHLHAHQIALRIEPDAVRAAGLSWTTYQAMMKHSEKPIGDEKLQKVAGDLDLTPYRDSRDFPTLERLTRSDTRLPSRR